MPPEQRGLASRCAIGSGKGSVIAVRLATPGRFRTRGRRCTCVRRGRRDSINSTNLGNHSRGRGAGYAALDIRALKRFSFSFGGREELYAGFGSQFSPTAAAGVWLHERVKLRASASRAFRIPTYTDLYYSDPRTLGNPNLKPESAWSYEAGLDWNASGTVSVVNAPSFP